MAAQRLAAGLAGLVCRLGQLLLRLPQPRRLEALQALELLGDAGLDLQLESLRA